jgi:hypothetical protein
MKASPVNLFIRVKEELPSRRYYGMFQKEKHPFAEKSSDLKNKTDK